MREVFKITVYIYLMCVCVAVVVVLCAPGVFFTPAPQC